MEISVVAAHGFSPCFMPANQTGRYLSLFVDQTSMMELRAGPAALPVIGRKGWGALSIVVLLRFLWVDEA
jgi:hypothetical protein